jgi:hypothetical protein
LKLLAHTNRLGPIFNVTAKGVYFLWNYCILKLFVTGASGRKEKSYFGLRAKKELRNIYLHG